MTVAVSTNYRKLSPEEVPAIAAELDAAWKDEAIPMRQWISVVRSEVGRYRTGESQPHFDILVRAMKRTGLVNPAVLEVGASSGFYSEILKLGGFPCRYTGLDFSPAYERMAQQLYPGIDFKVGDARSLPFEDNSFEIVLSGNVILHLAEYEKAIAESARVSSQFVVMNKCPVMAAKPTEFYEKEGYGVRMMEICFNEDELLGLFAKYGLEVVTAENIHGGIHANGGQRTYLCKVSA